MGLIDDSRSIKNKGRGMQNEFISTMNKQKDRSRVFVIIVHYLTEIVKEIYDSKKRTPNKEIGKIRVTLKRMELLHGANKRN